MLCQKEIDSVKGNLEFSDEWVLFATLEQGDELLPQDVLKSIPDEIDIAGKKIKAEKIRPFRNQFDFKSYIGKPFDDNYFKKVGYFFIPVIAEEDGPATIGVGGDNWIQAWLNGRPLFDGEEIESKSYPPKIIDNITEAEFKKGGNLLVVRLVTGKNVSTLAAGGAREIRKGDFRSIITDPLSNDSRWTNPVLDTKPQGKGSVDIASRLELFVDDFMIDDIAGGAERKMHNPVPREVVFVSDKPWEGPISGYYSIVQHDSKIRMYFSGRPYYDKKLYEGENVNTDYAIEQTTCMVESTDAINFVRPNLGLVEFNGSKENNIVYHGVPSHNFTPFIDTNPQAIPEQRFKAIAYAEKGHGLSIYASADGIKWQNIHDGEVMASKCCSAYYGVNKDTCTTDGLSSAPGFDSQNLAFWDANINKYVCYYRSNYGGFRRIFRSVSDDFVNWSDFGELEYKDGMQYQHYTNCIMPYPSAPHIYVGMPVRYVSERKKIKDHVITSINDVMLMSSRDGKVFERWEDGFIRPGPDPKLWTDRNYYPAWGMVQTSAEEISIYWTEHYRAKSNRLRRGTLRTDGFASLHAGTKEVGEVLTRPFVFSGRKLNINYATSAIGSIRFEICDESGSSIEGYKLGDSEVLYGNEIGHAVLWNESENIGNLSGKNIRLRIRLQDADLYSFRFTE